MFSARLRLIDVTINHLDRADNPLCAATVGSMRSLRNARNRARVPSSSALVADWPPEKLKEARESGSLLEASEVANVLNFMLTRPRGMTIRDGVMLPTNL